MREQNQLQECMSAGQTCSARQSADPRTGLRSNRRLGKQNYSTEDVHALLGICSDVEPLGFNMWTMVEGQFCAWADAPDRPHPDGDTLRAKFDKIANARKKTGGPSSPTEIRRAKKIARKILAQVCTASLGGAVESEGAE